MTALAIDQGTTSTRALLVDAAGRITPLLGLPHRQSYPRPGWVEHDPEELIANLRACLDAAGGIADLAAVGLANQGESCLAWDSHTGQALGPVIVWQDDRTRDHIEDLRRAGAEPLVRDRAGLPLDAYFSASKLGWIMREIPQAATLAAQGRLRLGTTDAFFRDRLTGRFETDVTTASRTALMNLATCTWDTELCALFGVPPEALPAIGPTTGALGALVCGARAVPLTASIVDQQASLHGHGCRDAGDTKITFGTGAFALSVSGPTLHRTEDGPLPTVAWQKAGEAPVYALDGGVYAASAAVNWARGLGLFADFAEIDDFTAPPAIGRGLVFVPALAGLACPHWDRRARGAWMGLSLDTGPRDMMQAVLEGVAFRTAQVIAAIARHQPVGAPIPIDGGMTANRYFCQFLADTLGRELIVSDAPELTAVGAATLAAEAAGQQIAANATGRRITPRAQPPGFGQAFDAACAMVRGFGAGGTGEGAS